MKAVSPTIGRCRAALTTSTAPACIARCSLICAQRKPSADCPAMLFTIASASCNSSRTGLFIPSSFLLNTLANTAPLPPALLSESEFDEIDPLNRITG